MNATRALHPFLAPAWPTLAPSPQAGVGWTLALPSHPSFLSIPLASDLGTREPCGHSVMESVGSGHQPIG